MSGYGNLVVDRARRVLAQASRRRFLGALGVGGAALWLTPKGAAADTRPPLRILALDVKSTVPENGKFLLPPLPYAYNALEPHIDTETMVLHHDRHHQAYVDALNTALAPYPALHTRSLADLLYHLTSLPTEIQTTVRNNGGGHINHEIFWAIMGPGGGGAPTGALAQAITTTFGSFDTFKAQLTEAARTRFGSGWGWLVADGAGALSIISTSNQNSPYMLGLTPLLGVDVWEHAYYLKYRNRRPDYLANWWNTVNWVAVAQRYAGVTS